MTPSELDELVYRTSSADGMQPGFRRAYVVQYSPPTMGIDFDDNASAGRYVFAKQAAGAQGIEVDPLGGTRVLWRH